MQEIILISSFNLVASVIFFIAAGKMYLVAKKKKGRTSISYFFYGLTFIAFYLFTKGLPGIFLKDGFLIAVLANFFRSFLLIGGMFFCLIPFHLLKMIKIEKIYIFSVLFGVVTGSVLGFLGLGGEISSYRRANYWTVAENQLLDYGTLIIGIFFVISLLVAAVFYFYFAYQKRKKEVAFGKALMIAISCLFLLGGGATSYVVGVFVKNIIVIGVIASLSYIIGAVTLIASVNYKGEKIKK